MEFLLHFADYGVKYIIMLGVMVAGVYAGCALRKAKNKKTA